MEGVQAMSMQVQSYNPYAGQDAQLIGTGVNPTRMQGYSSYNYVPSVFANPQQPQAQEQPKEEKLGFFGKLWNGAKGVVKGVVNGAANIVKGALGFETDANGKTSWNPLNMLKTAAMVGACFIPVAGPFVAAGLCAYGVVKSAPGVINGIAGVANAETATEAEAAGMQIGGDGLTLGLSLVGLRSSWGALKAANKAGMSAVNSAKQALPDGSKLSLSNTAKTYFNGANNPAMASLDAASQAEGMTWKQIGKQTAEGTWNNIKTFGKTVKETAKENNPFTLKGRNHIVKSAKARVEGIKDVRSAKTQYKQEIADFDNIIKEAKTPADKAIWEQAKQEFVDSTVKPSYTQTGAKVAEARTQNNSISDHIKELKTELRTLRKAKVVDTFEVARVESAIKSAQGLARQSYFPIEVQPFNYNSLKTLVPPMAVGSMSEAEQYIPQTATMPIAQTQSAPQFYSPFNNRLNAYA